MNLTREHQIAFAAWTAANDRARRDYQLHPTAFGRMCVVCDKTPGTTYRCARCKATRRGWAWREKRKEAAA